MSPPRDRPLIFLVDDDENILKSLRISLARHYEVATCSNAAQAVLQIDEKKPDVVVLDIKMPEHDGFWVFREIRRFDPDVPIIFNSAYQDAMAQDDVQGVYASFGYLRKNGSLGEFLKLMADAVAASRTRKGHP